MAFEAAEMEPDPEQRRKLLNFVVVGAGPTGVELAASIAELAHRALASDFRRIDPRSARILLLEATERILASFPEELSHRAQRALNGLGVEVQLNMPVTHIDHNGVTAAGQTILSNNVIWCAGVFVKEPVDWLKVAADRTGRVCVQPDLSLPEDPSVFVIGDAAYVKDEKLGVLPAVAPVALQEADFVGKVLKARLKGSSPPKKFRYKDKGNLATIGRTCAVADLNRFRVSGFFAWLIWVVVHIYYLIGFRNRIIVLIHWAWSCLTYQRGSRLIESSRLYDFPLKN
jgi:NADH dehydrogenase